MEFIKSERGVSKLIYENYVYVKSHKLVGGIVVYECENRRRENCKAKIKIYENEVLEKLETHLHCADSRKIEAYMLKSKLKQKAEETSQTTQQILTEVVEIISGGVGSMLPSVHHLKRNVRRYRQKGNIHHPLPSNLTNMDIPDEHKVNAKIMEKLKKSDMTEDSNSTKVKTETYEEEFYEFSEEIRCPEFRENSEALIEKELCSSAIKVEASEEASNPKLNADPNGADIFVSDGLLNYSHSKTERKRSSPKKRKTAASVVMPTGEYRFDQIGHFPIYTNSQNRCRFCPRGKVQSKCTKCGIYLCVVKGRNCFYKFHHEN